MTIMAIERYFLDWQKGAAETIADFLFTGCVSYPPDLSDSLVLVPTRQAGRRLREQLALAADTRGTGLIAPVVAQPETLLSFYQTDKRAASRSETVALTTKAILKAGPQDMEALFPSESMRETMDFSTAFACAKQMCELRYLLGEDGLTMRQAAAALAEEFENPESWEPERWEDLIRIEDAYFGLLDECGLVDRNRFARTAAEAGILPEGIRRIVVACVPDMQRIVVRALSCLENSVEIQILVRAPLEFAGSFDLYGRPLPEVWADPKTCVHVEDESILQAAGPGEQAEEVVRFLRGFPVEDTAIGALDEETGAFVRELLEKEEIRTFDPSGVELTQTSVLTLFLLFCELIREDSFEGFSRLLRHPDFADKLSREYEDFSVMNLLKQLDTFQNRHLPVSFSEAANRLKKSEEQYSDLARAAALANELRKQCRGQRAAESVFVFFREIFEGKRFEEKPDAVMEQVIEKVCTILTEFDDSPACSKIADFYRQLDLLTFCFQSEMIFPEPSVDAHPINGWLELLWCDEPALVVTGFNDEAVPEAVVGHLFLPDKARTALGLSDNARRLARDAYVLSALTGARKPEFCRIVFGKTNETGDVLKPSRLLFRVPDPRLPERVETLFAPIPKNGSNLSWTRAWKLRPRRKKAPQSLSVTGFRDYLACPFRFYLKRVLGMEEIDDAKAELDAMDFGNLCHRALELFATDENIRESADSAKIAEYLCNVAEREAYRIYGPALTAAVSVQLTSVLQRLRAIAEVQAQLRKEGWRIERAEYKLGNGEGVVLNGVKVKGIVDRIDVHEDGKRVRIIDYKTFEKSKSPMEAHLKSKPRNPVREFEQWSIACLEDKEWIWTDLQLPLYAHFMQKEFPDSDIECAYFVLPKAVTETRLIPWDGLNAFLPSALRCAEGVLTSIADGVFTPPVEKVLYDDFESLFFENVADSVDLAELEDSNAC